MSPDTTVDNKISKKVYARENNDSALTFVFDSDPNLCLEKNKIEIGFCVEISDKYIPENGFASKLFSSLAVEINSQLISTNKTRNEYPLIDRLSKVGNFDSAFYTKAFITEGYFDIYSFTELTDESDKKKLIDHRRKYLTPSNNSYRYQFILVPNHGFLNTSKPLPPKTELKLTFERATADHSLIKVGEDSSLSGSVIKISNAFAQTSYISSPFLRNYFNQIEIQPIKYTYEETSVVTRNIQTNQQIIRLENIYGGDFDKVYAII